MKKTLVIISLFLGFSTYAQQKLVSDDSLKSKTLEEVQIIASFSTKQFSEPVSLSTIYSEQIANKVSNQEFPEVLKSIPSIYTSKQGGGFGDSRITLRGFGSDNIALMINGIPVNGMENSSIYWSNWAGLSDVARAVQVQRGIGLSKLGLYSVGGTINILTQGTELNPGGSVFYNMGNDGFQKTGFSFSTGESKSGWSASFMGSRTSGDGFVLVTNFESWSYFANISKKLGYNHRLSFTAFGANQWHNRRSNKHSIEDYENHRDGIRMNTSFGYINGKIVSTYSGYNEYHKPQLALNHYWTINSHSSLSTVAYASIATGGGRKVYGADANRLQYNYKTGKPNTNTSLTPDGYIDYGPVMADNKASENGSKAIFTMGTNSHDWYGFLSNYTNRFNNGLTLTAGIDGRYYKGFHYDKISDLLGGSYFLDNKLAWRNPDVKLRVGDKVSQDYTSYITWLGGYSQLEYTNEKINTFASIFVTNHRYKREDPGKYGAYGNQDKYPISEVKSDWVNFLPVSVKGGFNYKFTNIHKAFINGGYVSRAPMLENVYADNKAISNAVNEKIATFELGYGLQTSNLNLSVSGYFTQWMDKSTTKNIGSWDGPKAAIPNLDARHMGIELDLQYSPIAPLQLGGFLSVGNWRWIDNVDFTYYDEQQNKVGEYHAYIKGVHVGNAPQTSLALTATWKVMKNLSVGADFNYYARFYADFSAIDRTKETDRVDAWKQPSFGLLDLNAQYLFKLGKVDLQWYANVNNLFNKEYICDALDGANHDRSSAVVWYGTGLTWTTGLRVSF